MLYNSEVALVVLCVMLGVLRDSGQYLDGQATCNEDTNSDPNFDKHPQETAKNDREMEQDFGRNYWTVSSHSQQIEQWSTTNGHVLFTIINAVKEL